MGRPSGMSPIFKYPRETPGPSDTAVPIRRLAMRRLLLHFPGIQADVDEDVTRCHRGPRVQGEHDARVRALDLLHDVAVRAHVAADQRALVDARAAARGRFEQASARGVDPG